MMLILTSIYDIPQLNLRTLLGAKKTTDIREWHVSLLKIDCSVVISTAEFLQASDVMQNPGEPEIWSGNDTDYNNIGGYQQPSHDRQDLLSVRNPSHPYYQ